MADEENQDAPVSSNADAAEEDNVQVEMQKNVEKDDNGGGDGDGDEEEDKLFDGSTHMFAIYYYETNDCNGCIISMFVIIIQMVLYSICAMEIHDKMDDQWWVPVTVPFGGNCMGSDVYFGLVSVIILYVLICKYIVTIFKYFLKQLVNNILINVRINK